MYFSYYRGKVIRLITVRIFELREAMTLIEIAEYTALKYRGRI
jgi:hypothetical protein